MTGHPQMAKSFTEAFPHFLTLWTCVTELLVIEVHQGCSNSSLKGLDSKKNQAILGSWYAMQGMFTHCQVAMVSSVKTMTVSKHRQHYEFCVGHVEHDCVPCSESVSC